MLRFDCFARAAGAARILAGLMVAAGVLGGCGGGGGSGGDDNGSGGGAVDCQGHCADTATALTTGDVKTVLAQGVAEAKARGRNATIAVVDRVGNVLAVYRMGAASARGVVIASQTTSGGDAVIDSGLEGIRLPTAAAPFNLDDLAAISKAVTGAYLSSEGNAFSTRTASQIVQSHFNPGVSEQPAGPLFGVQFSQLACSDFSGRYNGVGVDAGPKRSPLGLSADPGGFPLYKNGTVVGGVGVMADGVYGLDARTDDTDNDLDELIAWAATYNFAAPVERRADRITVAGLSLRFSDIDSSKLASNPANAVAFDNLGAGDGQLIAVSGYTNGAIQPGTAFGQAQSGVRADRGVFAAQDGFVFVDEFDLPRFSPRAGTDGAQALSAGEVETLLQEALGVANRARAQIRQPLNSVARVTVSVVDTNGEVLGMVRSRDAPVFGSDVSLQKARTAAFFSSSAAAGLLNDAPFARYLRIDDSGIALKSSVTLSDYVSAARVFLSNPTALADGAVAFSDRAGGNLSRPHFPDGIDGNGPGPFSKPAGSWSPFSTGLQLDLVINGVLQHVLATATGGALPDVGHYCAGVGLDSDLNASAPAPAFATNKKLANGIQIFPGSVPIYRGNVLVGAIGVSGDGVDQDDMIAFLGVHNAGAKLLSLNNAPAAMRADQLQPQGVRLRFVQCPQAPFLDSGEQTPCAGK